MLAVDPVYYLYSRVYILPPLNHPKSQICVSRKLGSRDIVPQMVVVEWAASPLPLFLQVHVSQLLIYYGVIYHRLFLVTLFWISHIAAPVRLGCWPGGCSVPCVALDKRGNRMDKDCLGVRPACPDSL